MSNVFISHSSKDKEFVIKLALALLSKGFPVWLDSWKMRSGDSLINEIYDGIEESSIVILVVSASSLSSGWVDKELNAAITKEDQTGRKFVIPILVDECRPPLKIADRIFENFSSSFSGPFAALCESLERKGAKDIDVALERELIALSFSKDVYLDKASFRSCVSNIEKRQKKLKITPSQIVTSNSSEYTMLFNKLHDRVDNIVDDKYYSPNFEESLRSLLEGVIEDEKRLREGVAMMVNNNASIEAIYWYCLLTRGQILYSLYNAQNPDDAEISDHGKKWWTASLVSNSHAAEFFEAEHVVPCDMWPKENPGAYIHFWIDKSELDLYSENQYMGPGSAISACGYNALNKYILPQAVRSYVTGNPDHDIPWSMKEYMIGQH